MTAFIEEKDIGAAWLAALTLLNSSGGAVVNLALRVEEPLTEDLGVRSAIEHHLAELRGGGHRDFGNVQSMHTVANTVFPIALYRPGPPDAAERFFANATRGDSARRRLPPSKRGWGTYIGRLVSYPSTNGERVNQLALMLENLRREKAWSDIYEMPVAVPGDDEAVRWETAPQAMSALTHGDVHADSRLRGGPCLAHLSATLQDGQVSLLAMYRRHSYMARAYGNFVGLARLLSFLAAESGHDIGTLMVVTGHAAIDGPGGRDLESRARDALGAKAQIETGARHLGASYSDLELPECRQ